MNRIQFDIKRTVSGILGSFTTIMLFATLLTSCSKEMGEAAGGVATLEITVGSITEEELTTPGTKSASTSSLAKLRSGETILNKETAKWKDIEVNIITAEGQDLSFGENRSYTSFEKVKHSDISKQMSLPGSINPLAADVPMARGVKYWVVLFNKSSQKIEQSLQCTSGTTTKIDVIRNQDYEWYAYSYDSEDDITPLDPANPEVQTKANRPFLYAKGTVKATALGNTPFSIVFKHQLQQFKIRMDARGLFGGITTLKAKFASGTFIKTSAFNVKTGTMTGALTTAPLTDLTFTDVEVDSHRQVEARYYTAELSQRSYTIDLNELKIILPNQQTENINTSNISLANRTFSFNTGGKGRVQFAKIDMYRVIPEKSILHVEGSTTYSYAASQPDKASGAFIRDIRNFSRWSEYVRVDGFTHETVGSSANTLKNRLANPANYPDIIIAGMFTGFNNDDYTAMDRYLDKGGVVFLMIENPTARTDLFFQKLFNSSAVKTKLYDWSGAVYKINNVDSDVLAWPFDDVRSKYWGQDASSTMYVENIPANEMQNIHVYTTSASNRRGQQPYNSVSMFRHKTKSLFFVGDTGLLSNRLAYGEFGNTKMQPFATNQQNFPIPNSEYGRVAESGSLDAGTKEGGWYVYNSAIFGNVLAYLIAQSHYIPIDRT